MKPEKLEGHERELPHAHVYHALLPIVFLVLWFLDCQIFKLSTMLNDYVPLAVRLSLFIVILGAALTFIALSHGALFESHRPRDSLVTTGLLGRVRNPMYFGILLIYVAFLCLSISFISMGLFLVVFLVYNKMVNFEEAVLENIFGDRYRDYKRNVSKWIPNPFKKG